MDDYASVVVVVMVRGLGIYIAQRYYRTQLHEKIVACLPFYPGLPGSISPLMATHE
jgi:hypothetical protein